MKEKGTSMYFGVPFFWHYLDKLMSSKSTKKPTLIKEPVLKLIQNIFKVKNLNQRPLQ